MIASQRSLPLKFRTKPNVGREPVGSEEVEGKESMMMMDCAQLRQRRARSRETVGGGRGVVHIILTLRGGYNSKGKFGVQLNRSLPINIPLIR